MHSLLHDLGQTSGASVARAVQRRMHGSDAVPDQEPARRADRRADAIATHTGGTGDAELDAYNVYLAKLNKLDQAD